MSRVAFLERGGKSVTTARKSFTFGALTIAFESDDSAWMDLLERRYGIFASDQAATFTILHRTNQSALPATLSSPLAVLNEEQQFQKTATGCLIRTPTAQIQIDLEQRRAWLDAPRAMYPLDHLLRQCLPMLWKDGLLFHAAALAGPKSFVACGPSGAGKSTLAKLVAPHAISDELCGIQRCADTFRLHSLPFWNARPESKALTAVLVLAHAREHRLTRLDSSEAFRRLHGNVLWPTEFPDRLSESLEELATLVESIPVYEFAFALDGEVWRYLMEQAE